LTFILQAHLKAAPANATPKLLKELAKKKFHQPGPKKWLHYANFNNTSYISDGLTNCLPQPGLLRYKPSKSMREKFDPFTKFCVTRTVPSTGTESIGLLAYTPLSWFLHRHLESFIVIRVPVHLP
jgi:hypothetical protein